MPGIEIKLRSGALTVAARVQARSDALAAAALEGAQQIAETMNSDVLPVVFTKPAVRASLVADAQPSRGQTLARVRLVQHGDKPLWKWWFYGTKPHPIDPRADNQSGLLVFFWSRYGRVVAFEHVDHPGATAHPATRDLLLTMLKTEARITWTETLSNALTL